MLLVVIVTILLHLAGVTAIDPFYFWMGIHWFITFLLCVFLA